MSTENANTGAETISEEELLKSLQKLEGKTEEVIAPPAPKAVATAALQKSAGEHIADTGSEELLKALDVSSVLGEAVSLIGAHVDNSLEALQKSVAAAGQRDLALIGAFENLMKKVDGLTEKLDQFGKTPASGVQAGATVRVLEKKVAGTGAVEVEGSDKAPSREVALGIMVNLAKSATPGSAESKRWSDAAIKFETTGSVSNADLLVVQKELKKAS